MLLGWRLLPVPLLLPPGWGRLRPTPLLLLLLLARPLLLPGWPGGLWHGCCLLLPLPMLLSIPCKTATSSEIHTMNHGMLAVLKSCYQHVAHNAVLRQD
jgi:hypothetical protein